jgi:hypothetical protein
MLLPISWRLRSSYRCPYWCVFNQIIENQISSRRSQQVSSKARVWKSWQFAGQNRKQLRFTWTLYKTSSEI